MKFEKYHGLGNDFIIFEEKEVLGMDYEALAKKICHRKFGIGADGMIIVAPSEKAPVFMKFYNADGSIAPMCGNGIRCFTHFIVNNGIIKDKTFKVDTLAGVLEVTWEETTEFMVRVYMGEPKYNPSQIPVNSDKTKFIKEIINTSYGEYEISSLFMGTTHTVILTDNLKKENIETVGKEIENNTIFPVKTNVNFMEVKAKNEVDVNTWERGAGFTYACGTGCCASVVIGKRFGLLSDKVKVNVPGGHMYIELQGDSVYMIGPSEKICQGEINN